MIALEHADVLVRYCPPACRVGGFGANVPVEEWPPSRAISTVLVLALLLAALVVLQSCNLACDGDRAWIVPRVAGGAVALWVAFLLVMILWAQCPSLDVRNAYRATFGPQRVLVIGR